MGLSIDWLSDLHAPNSDRGEPAAVPPSSDSLDPPAESESAAVFVAQMIVAAEDAVAELLQSAERRATELLERAEEKADTIVREAEQAAVSHRAARERAVELWSSVAQAEVATATASWSRDPAAFATVADGFAAALRELFFAESQREEELFAQLHLAQMRIQDQFTAAIDAVAWSRQQRQAIVERLSSLLPSADPQAVTEMTPEPTIAGMAPATPQEPAGSIELAATAPPQVEMAAAAAPPLDPALDAHPAPDAHPAHAADAPVDAAVAPKTSRVKALLRDATSSLGALLVVFVAVIVGIGLIALVL